MGSTSAHLSVVLVAIVLGGCGKSPAEPEPSTHTSRELTVPAVDEEFRIAASQKGETELVAAKMLIDLRNNDNWSWERLEGEVDFQFGGIKDEFDQWKQDRIAAGDRYK